MADYHREDEFKRELSLLKSEGIKDNPLRKEYEARVRGLQDVEKRMREDRLGGLAGKGHGEETARRTADVLNQLHPYLMYLTTVSVLPGTELYEERRRGDFIEQDEKERLLEFMTLLGEMNNDIRVFAAPNTTRFSFDIDLQKEKGEVIERMRSIREQLTEQDEARIQAYRDAMTSV